MKCLEGLKIKHVIIDGAHAVGNHVGISEIPMIIKNIKEKLGAEIVTYIFDFYKWIQGMWGMSVVLSTDPKITS